MKLLKIVKPLSGFILFAIILGIISNLLATFITIMGGFAILNILGFEFTFITKSAFILALLFAILRGFFRYGEQALNHYIAFKVLALIRNQVFISLRRLSPAKLEVKDKGNLISIITSDIELLEVFYAHTISPIMIALGTSIFMSIFIAKYHWVLGIITVIAYFVVGVIIPIGISKKSNDIAKNYREKSGKLSSFVLESLRGVSEIIQYQNGTDRLLKMEQQMDYLSSEEKKIKQLTGMNTAITNITILIFNIILLITATVLYTKNKVQFDGVLIPVMALISSFGPVVALANLGTGLQYTLAAGSRVLDILEEKPQVDDIINEDSVEFMGVKVENISFGYEEVVLKNISIDIPYQGLVGITGKSGSGKSTLLKLLMRFWDVQKGSIKISNKKINKINTSDLRNMESYVTQDTHLFQDTIENNLRIAKLNATKEEIENACKKASIHKFIIKLPQGYNTQVGELGGTLSGGERQRIGLARAFLSNAPFMLLDEPTSNLDSLNEAVILKTLKEETSNKTVVIVSHRQSTLAITTKAFIVENGMIS